MRDGEVEDSLRADHDLLEGIGRGDYAIVDRNRAIEAAINGMADANAWHAMTFFDTIRHATVNQFVDPLSADVVVALLPRLQSWRSFPSVASSLMRVMATQDVDTLVGCGFPEVAFTFLPDKGAVALLRHCISDGGVARMLVEHSADLLILLGQLRCLPVQQRKVLKLLVGLPMEWSWDDFVELLCGGCRVGDSKLVGAFVGVAVTNAEACSRCCSPKALEVVWERLEDASSGCRVPLAHLLARLVVEPCFPMGLLAERLPGWLGGSGDSSLFLLVADAALEVSPLVATRGLCEALSRVLEDSRFREGAIAAAVSARVLRLWPDAPIPLAVLEGRIRDGLMAPIDLPSHVLAAFVAWAEARVAAGCAPGWLSSNGVAAGAEALLMSEWKAEYGECIVSLLSSWEP